jgi:hypothetical protein
LCLRPVESAYLREIGAAEEGRELSADPGIWTGAGSITFAYQWQRCNEKRRKLHHRQRRDR